MLARCILMLALVLTVTATEPCLTLPDDRVSASCPWHFSTDNTCLPLRLCRALPRDVASPAWSACNMVQNFVSLCQQPLQWEQEVAALSNFSVCARSRGSWLAHVTTCADVHALLACRPVRHVLDDFPKVYAALGRACPSGLKNVTKNLKTSEEFVRDHLVSADFGFPVLTLLAGLSFLVVATFVDLSPPWSSLGN